MNLSRRALLGWLGGTILGWLFGFEAEAKPRRMKPGTYSDTYSNTY